MEVITFVSGKGGSGKTIITANIGAYVARAGYKTLLIDWDFFARGLSYYILEGTIELSSGSGLLEAFNTNSISNIKPYSIQENLDILSPSICTQRIITFEDINNNLSDIKLIYAWHSLIELLNDKFKYDFVFIDAHSGSEFISLVTTFFSDEYIIVCEEDRTSWRVSSLVKETIRKYSNNFDNDSKFRQYSDNIVMHEPRFGGFILNQTIGTTSGVSIKFIEKQVLNGKCLCIIPLDYKVRRAFALDQLVIDVLPFSPFSSQIRKFSRDHLVIEVPVLPPVIIYKKMILKTMRNPMSIVLLLIMYISLFLFMIGKNFSESQYSLTSGILMATLGIAMAFRLLSKNFEK